VGKKQFFDSLNSTPAIGTRRERGEGGEGTRPEGGVLRGLPRKEEKGGVGCFYLKILAWNEGSGGARP